MAASPHSPSVPLEGRARAGWMGVYAALVTDVRDPEGLGRVHVRLPWAPDGAAEHGAWARIATLMAGPHRGTWCVPDVGTEVLVAFEGGDPARPCVMGALWSAAAPPPVAMDAAGGNHLTTLRSRSGLSLTLDDQPGAERIAVETPGGQRLVLAEAAGRVEIADANGNTVVLDAGGVTVRSAARVSVEASTAVVSASVVTVNAGMAKFSGVVQVDTLIANSVISASYTPGAGNIL